MSTEGNNRSNSSSADFLAKYADYAPAVIDFIKNNPDNVFAKILAVLAGFIFDEGSVDFPLVEEEMKPLLAERAVRQVDAIHAARTYNDALVTDPDNPPEKITTRYQGSNQDVELTLQKFVSDPETGFKGAIYRDANGHSVVLFGGMDMLNGIDMKDLEAVAQTRLMKQGVNQQTGPAQELYLEAVRTSESTEIVGYSLGAMLANDMAARLDAKATTIADIGLPDVKDADGNSMYTAEHIQNIRENVTVVKAGNDSYYAKAGNVYGGTVVPLPQVSGIDVLAALGQANLPNQFNAQSTVVAHHPLAYVLGSERLMPPDQRIAAAPAATPGVTGS